MSLRLAVFRKPRRNRYKVYVLGHKGRHVPGPERRPRRRIAVTSQPREGFGTLDEAYACMSRLDMRTELKHFLESTGSRVPPDEEEIPPRSRRRAGQVRTPRHPTTA